MSVRIKPGEEHLGYAPEREAWDARFKQAGSRTDEPDEPEGDERGRD